MRLAIASIDDSASIAMGGKHIHQELLIEGLRRNGHDAVRAFPDRSMEANPGILDRARSKALRHLGSFGRVQDFKATIDKYARAIERQLKELLAGGSIDAIGAQDSVAACAAYSAMRASGRRVPVCLTLHGYFPRETINYGGYQGAAAEAINELTNKIENDAIRGADGIVTVDSRIRDYVLERDPSAARVRVLFNAIDTDRFFVPSQSQKSEARRAIGVDERSFMVLVARRLVPKNGVGFAVEAMRRIADSERAGIALVIAGEGPEETSLKQAARGLEPQAAIRFVGGIPHSAVDAYYKAADIVLMPSVKSNDIEEATSLAMLEGMACGKTVIASAIGGMKEVIKDDWNGILVPDADPDAIAAAMLRLKSDEAARIRLGQNAGTYAKEHHGFVSHAKEYQAFVASLA